MKMCLDASFAKRQVALHLTINGMLAARVLGLSFACLT